MAVSPETGIRIGALTKRNRGGGVRRVRSSRHLTIEEEIREVYAMEARQYYSVNEADALGWYDFELSSSGSHFALFTEYNGWISR